MTPTNPPDYATMTGAQLNAEEARLETQFQSLRSQMRQLGLARVALARKQDQADAEARRKAQEAAEAAALPELKANAPVTANAPTVVLGGVAQPNAEALPQK